MPWTQTKYPVSMKNLPVAVRKKAIQIANAILKDDKKMKEGVVIATAIKNAETFYSKKSKSAKATPKKKAAVKKAAVKKAAVKKVIAKVPVKAKSKKKVAAKKVTGAVKKETKVASVKKAKVIAKKATKTPVKTPVKASVKAAVKKKSDQKRKFSKPSETVVDSFIIEPLIPIEEALREDQHFIPQDGDVKPIDPIQIHNYENVFHHREEVAMHQENKKVNDAKASRKSYKRTYRMNGNR